MLEKQYSRRLYMSYKTAYIASSAQQRSCLDFLTISYTGLMRCFFVTVGKQLLFFIDNIPCGISILFFNWCRNINVQRNVYSTMFYVMYDSYYVSLVLIIMQIMFLLNIMNSINYIQAFCLGNGRPNFMFVIYFFFFFIHYIYKNFHLNRKSKLVQKKLKKLPNMYT